MKRTNNWAGRSLREEGPTDGGPSETRLRGEWTGLNRIEEWKNGNWKGQTLRREENPGNGVEGREEGKMKRMERMKREGNQTRRWKKKRQSRKEREGRNPAVVSRTGRREFPGGTDPVDGLV